ncbi:MAG: hypothetical protein OHK0011_25860 [Turneriella sp.]
MGLWSAIKRLFSGKDEATRIKELAAELMRYADRYENADDSENAALARDYAERVASARTLKEAKALYSEFKSITARYDDDGYHDRHRRTIVDDRDTDTDTDDDWSDDS